jgi:hypothetical protein
MGFIRKKSNASSDSEIAPRSSSSLSSNESSASSKQGRRRVKKILSKAVRLLGASVEIQGVYLVPTGFEAVYMPSPIAY